MCRLGNRHNQSDSFFKRTFEFQTHVTPVDPPPERRENPDAPGRAFLCARAGNSPTFKNGKAAPARAAVFRFGSILADQPM
jgi:hypothetical protein